MASYLLSLLLPSPSISYNSLNTARNDPGMHMDQHEETLCKQVQQYCFVNFITVEYSWIALDRVNSHTKSDNIPRTIEAIITKLELG